MSRIGADPGSGIFRPLNLINAKKLSKTALSELTKSAIGTSYARNGKSSRILEVWRQFQASKAGNGLLYAPLIDGNVRQSDPR